MSAENATYLYAIRARYTPFVKIGVTSDPQGRIKRMQTETPHALYFAVCAPCERAYDVEQWMHRQLKHRHIRGEWFWVWRNSYMHNLVRNAITLRDQDKLPIAAPYWQRIQGAQDILSARPISSREVRDRLWQTLMQSRTRPNLVAVLVSCGWNVSEIRAVVRGDNNVLGPEIDAAKKKLGIVDEPRQLRVRDEKGERMIPMEAP